MRLRSMRSEILRTEKRNFYRAKLAYDTPENLEPSHNRLLARCIDINHRCCTDVEFRTRTKTGVKHMSLEAIKCRNCRM